MLDLIEWSIPEPMTNAAPLFTLQRFTETAPPWFALHKQTDSGATWGLAGERSKVDAWCREHGIKPEELPPIPEALYFNALRSVRHGGPYRIQKHLTGGIAHELGYRIGLKFTLSMLGEDVSGVRMPG